MMSGADVSVATQRPAAEQPSADGERQSRPLSELLPRGRRAFVVGAVSAALVAAGFVRYGWSGWAILGLVFCPVLVLLASIDLEHRLLPNRLVLPAAVVVTAIVGISQPDNLVAHLAAGVALGALFFAIGAFFPGSLGFGDAKLGLLLGLALGTKTFAAVEIALLAVVVVALYLIFTRGMAARKQTIPFGPFLALGGIIGFFLV
jgi:leader peptidase (prepilin peptidase) / N-methyltransferase